MTDNQGFFLLRGISGITHTEETIKPFNKLDIATKITLGKIEILSDNRLTRHYNPLDHEEIEVGLDTDVDDLVACFRANGGYLDLLRYFEEGEFVKFRNAV